MLLADKNYSYCVFVRKDIRIWEDDAQYQELFVNLALGKTLNKLSDSIEQQEDYFVVVDNENGQVLECMGDEELEKIATSFGTLTYLSEKDNRQLYFEDNEEDYIIEQFEDSGEPEIQIIVFDNADGKIIDVARFDETLTYIRK